MGKEDNQTLYQVDKEMLDAIITSVKEALEEVLQNFVREEVDRQLPDKIKDLHVECNLGLQDTLKDDVQGAIHDIRQLGEGSLGKGLAEMNENHRWITSVRTKSEKASWAFTIAILGIAAAGTVAVFMAGVYSKLKGQ